jgi:probable addiction module antidote protein
LGYILIVVEIRKTDHFAEWLDSLRDLHMNKTKTSKYDVAEHLRTPKEMAAYLEACMDEADGDAAFIAKALGDIARAKGMTKVARDAGLSRESLYKALSGERSPEFGTILKVVDALGLKLHAQPAH